MVQPGPDPPVALAVQARAEDLGAGLGHCPKPRPARHRSRRRPDLAASGRQMPRHRPLRGGGRLWRGRAARPGRPGPGHRRAAWPERGPGSSPRPPASQRAPTLEGSNLLLQQLVGHGHLAELALSRSSSSSRPSRSRSFIAVSAATRARSRHSVRRATVTLSSRARASSGAPRSRRVTAASLRCAEKRRSGPAPPRGRRRQRSGRTPASPRAHLCGSDPLVRSPVAVASTAAGCLIEPGRTPVRQLRLSAA
jgi:hypothetical protein